MQEEYKTPTYADLFERLVILETKLDMMSKFNGNSSRRFSFLAGLIISLQVFNCLFNYYLVRGAR